MYAISMPCDVVVRVQPVKGMSAREVKSLIIMSPIKVRLELDRGSREQDR